MFINKIKSKFNSFFLQSGFICKENSQLLLTHITHICLRESGLYFFASLRSAGFLGLKEKYRRRARAHEETKGVSLACSINKVPKSLTNACHTDYFFLLVCDNYLPSFTC